MAVEYLLRSILINSKNESAKALAVSQRSILNRMFHEVMEEYEANPSVAAKEHDFAGYIHGKTEPDGWCAIKGHYNGTLRYNNRKVRYRSLEDNKSGFHNDFVSIFMPVGNGEKSIFRALVDTHQEANILKKNDCACEINICLNHTTDDTLSRVLRFKQMFAPSMLNIFEIRQDKKSVNGKTDAINFLYRRLSNRLHSRRAANLYIHIADDDIGILRNPGGIFRNVRALRNHPNLKAISGACTTSKHTSGFQFLSSIRKAPDIMENIRVLPQIYGAALTIRYQDFPPQPLPAHISMDPFITLYYLGSAIDNGIRLEDMMRDPDQLPIKINRSFLFEHAEPADLMNYARRLLRDIENRKMCVRYFGLPDLERIFLELRRFYYDQITHEVNQVGDHDRRYIGQRWLKEIRKNIYELNHKEKLKSRDIQTLFPKGAIENPHQLCRRVIRYPNLMESVCHRLESKNLLYPHSISDVIKPEITRNSLFKRIERILQDQLGQLVKQNYLDHPVVYLLSKIIENKKKTMKHLKPEATVRHIFKRAGLDLKDDVSITEQNESGYVNYSFFIRSGCDQYFMRYHDPLGKNYFQRYNPGRTIYIYLVCTRIFGELLGRDRIIETLFPDPYSAVRNYDDTEDCDIFEQLINRIIIQKDIRNDFIELHRFKEIGLEPKHAIRLYAGVLADVHGASYGVIRYHKNPRSSTDRLLNILKSADADIRFSSEEAYGSWLQNHYWVTRIFRTLNQNSRGRNHFYDLVADSLANGGGSIEDRFNTICSRSIERFRDHAGIGHMDLSMDNIFINRSDYESYKVFDFNNVTFIDSIFEIGYCLYTVIREAVFRRKIAELNDLMAWVSCFNATYVDRFSSRLTRNDYYNEEKKPNLDEWIKESNFFCGLTVLSVFATHPRTYGMSDRQIHLLSRLCVHLINN